MIAVLLLLGAAFLGIALVRLVLRTSLNCAEQVLWGIVIGWTLMTVLGYGAARLAGSLGSTTVLLVTLLTWSAALAAWLPCVRGGVLKHWPGWDRSFTPLLVLLLLFTPVYVHLFNTHMLPVGTDGGIYSGGESSYYDLAYHAAVTTSFVHGSNFPPLYTPFPPAPLLYPFLPDFLTALLMAGGMSLHTALVATAVPLCLALTGIFYFFASRLLHLQQGQSRSSQAWAAIATLLFFLNGGLGFIYFFQGGRLDVNYTHLPAKALVWPNVITDMLLPQHPSMFGLGIGLIVLSCFAMSWTGKKTDARWAGWQHPLAAGVLAGFLPFFHVHSFIAVVFISGILFLLRPRRIWLLFWLPALVIALPRLVEFSHLATSGFVRWQPGWRGQDQPSWLLFFLRNVGVPALLIIPAWVKASRHLRLFYVSFVGLLALALLVVISPNDYDNLKLMTYWYAATAVLVADWLGRIGRRPFGWIFSIPLIVVSILSGTLAVVAESQSSRLMFSPDEVAAAAFVRANTDPHSLFLTAPTLHQPILSLAGRKVVRGPTAWLWSHGYPFAEREADVRAIYAGGTDALELLRYYRPDYIYLGRHESEELKANRQFFETTFPSIYQQAGITIYDARKLRNDDRTGLSDYPPREFASRIDRDPSEVLKEFQSIAYELYRLRKVTLGSTPGFGEFADDLRQLGRGLYLGAPGWKKVLEDNERLLCQQLAAHYEGKSDAECLAAFYANAGLQPSNSDMTFLIQELAAGRETRATILRRIAGDRSLFRREYNTAYVLSHYFAYLKRDPDKAPDHDLTGFNFWRQQLDRTHDYRGLTRAFMESDEYKAQ
ncbi:MAG: hypothetical protein WAO00_08815 [Chthoniobacterales bacterium]